MESSIPHNGSLNAETLPPHLNEMAKTIAASVENMRPRINEALCSVMDIIDPPISNIDDTEIGGKENESSAIPTYDAKDPTLKAIGDYLSSIVPDSEKNIIPQTLSLISTFVKTFEPVTSELLDCIQNIKLNTETARDQTELNKKSLLESVTSGVVRLLTSKEDSFYKVPFTVVAREDPDTHELDNHFIPSGLVALTGSASNLTYGCYVRTVAKDSRGNILYDEYGRPFDSVTVRPGIPNKKNAHFPLSENGQIIGAYNDMIMLKGTGGVYRCGADPKITGWLDRLNMALISSDHYEVDRLLNMFCEPLPLLMKDQEAPIPDKYGNNVNQKPLEPVEYWAMKPQLNKLIQKFGQGNLQRGHNDVMRGTINPGTASEIVAKKYPSLEAERLKTVPLGISGISPFDLALIGEWFQLANKGTFTSLTKGTIGLDYLSTAIRGIGYMLERQINVIPGTNIDIPKYKLPLYLALCGFGFTNFLRTLDPTNALANTEKGYIQWRSLVTSGESVNSDLAFLGTEYKIISGTGEIKYLLSRQFPELVARLLTIAVIESIWPSNIPSIKDDSGMPLPPSPSQVASEKLNFPQDQAFIGEMKMELSKTDPLITQSDIEIPISNLIEKLNASTDPSTLAIDSLFVNTFVQQPGNAISPEAFKRSILIKKSFPDLTISYGTPTDQINKFGILVTDQKGNSFFNQLNSGSFVPINSNAFKTLPEANNLSIAKWKNLVKTQPSQGLGTFILATSKARENNPQIFSDNIILDKVVQAIPKEYPPSMATIEMLGLLIETSIKIDQNYTNNLKKNLAKGMDLSLNSFINPFTALSILSLNSLMKEGSGSRKDFLKNSALSTLFTAAAIKSYPSEAVRKLIYEANTASSRRDVNMTRRDLLTKIFGFNSH